ncbi:hypothetical protein ACFYV7_29245 [Nocardia suismassiliense]|uniref:Uncharacterized protein n=1 Tax=Nocardia suismassiliense TaxID=2077092 RepID=A0ABW6R074_9NOCA
MERGGIQLREIVRDGVHFAVTQDYASAEETRVLEALLRDPDDARVVRRLRRQRRNGDPLGFGVGEIVPVLGPLLLIVVEESIRTVTGAATDSMSARFATRLRQVFRRPAVITRLPELSRDQLRTVHDSIVEELVQSQVPDETARALAERITGRLAIDEPDGRDDQGS